jgi:hypothetical protein
LAGLGYDGGEDFSDLVALLVLGCEERFGDAVVFTTLLNSQEGFIRLKKESMEFRLKFGRR